MEEFWLEEYEKELNDPRFKEKVNQLKDKGQETVEYKDFMQRLQEESENTNYCKDWLKTETEKTVGAAVPALIIVTINIATCMILEAIAFFEKSHTTNDETKGQF